MNENDENGISSFHEAMQKQFHDQNIVCHFHMEQRKAGTWESVGGGVTNLPVGCSFTFLADTLLVNWMEERVSEEDRKADGFSAVNYRVFVWVTPEIDGWKPELEEDERKAEHDELFNYKNTIVCKQGEAHMPQDVPSDFFHHVGKLVLMGVLEGAEVSERNGAAVIKIIPVNGAELKTSLVGAGDALNGIFAGWIAGRSELPAHYLSSWERHQIPACKKKNRRQTKRRNARAKAAEKDPLAILMETPEMTDEAPAEEAVVTRAALHHELSEALDESGARHRFTTTPEGAKIGITATGGVVKVTVRLPQDGSTTWGVQFKAPPSSEHQFVTLAYPVLAEAIKAAINIADEPYK